VIDGDTIEVLFDGQAVPVRYIGIDDPEPNSGGGTDLLAAESTGANADLVEGQPVILEKDVSDTDRFGRLLRYVWLRDGDRWLFVNLELVRLGFASAVSYPPDVAKLEVLLEAERQAKVAAVGLWEAAPSSSPLKTPGITSSPTQNPAPSGQTFPELVIVDAGPPTPFRGARGPYTWQQVLFTEDRVTVRWDVTASTACTVGWRIDAPGSSPIRSTIRVAAGRRGRGNGRYDTLFLDAVVAVSSTCGNWLISMQGYTPPVSAAGGGGDCDPSYPDVCIPPYPPDLDCGEVSFQDFRVRGSDPHGFDGDNDGIGCES